MSPLVTNGKAATCLALLAALLALGAIAMLGSCATPEVTKTTIKIAKGKVGQPSSWSVSSSQAEKLLGSVILAPGKPIPTDWWGRMNGTVESFTEYDCDGTATGLIQPLYTVLNEKGGPEEVKVVGDVGQKPDWGPVHCDDQGCFLPAYYFNEVVKDPRDCSEKPERHWEMILIN